MIPLDPDRTLALAYVPAARRPAVEALWRLDAALASVLATGCEPMISRIRLAWWRESLEALDRERAPAEPVLSAVAAAVLPAGVSGTELAEMVTGWEVLLSPEPLGPAELELYAAARGGLLFLYSARLLGGADNILRQAGGTWALIDLARHSGNAVDVEAALAAVHAPPPPRRIEARLRPLGMLAALARRDAEPERPHWEQPGAPRRMLRMLLHRLTGN